MWVTDLVGGNIYAYNLPQPPESSSGGSGNSDDSEDSTLSVLRLSGIELNPVFSPDNLFYTAVVDHTVAMTTVTATPNDLESAVDILWASDRAATSLTASRGPRVSLKEGYNFIAVDVTAENGGHAVLCRLGDEGRSPADIGRAVARLPICIGGQQSNRRVLPPLPPSLKNGRANSFWASLCWTATFDLSFSFLQKNSNWKKPPICLAGIGGCCRTMKSKSDSRN